MTDRARAAPRDLTVALVPWGDVIEDYLDGIGVSLRSFCEDMTGGWLFGYVTALDSAGIRTIVYCVSTAVAEPTSYVNGPTGATFRVLPAPRGFLGVRRLGAAGADPGRITRSLREASRYLATPRAALAAAIRGDRCDAILVQEYEWPRFDACVAIGRRLDVPVFATFQGGMWHGSRIEAVVRPRSIQRCAGLIIAPSTEIERVRRRYGVPSDRIAQVFNPIDPRLWTPVPRDEARRHTGVPADARVAVWHGRVDIHRKGLDVLLDAWQRITSARSGRDLRLVLIGTGDDAGEFRRMVEAASLPGLHWRDEYLLDRAELIRHLCAADVYTLPSRHEGFAVAPIEAMACGLAVVAADAPGVPDVLAGGEAAGGIIVPREDAGALADALGRALDEPAWCAAMGAAGQRRVRSTFSTGAVGEQLRAFLLRRGLPSGTTVSVIIPCYDQARFLPEAIESALAQTYPDVEVVVVDDGSTDDTTAVAARYDRVLVVRQTNQGVSSARNTGLTHAHGDFVVFLDADDRLLPDAVETAMRRFADTPDAAFVYGGFRWIDARGRLLGVHQRTGPTADPYVALLRGNHIGMNGAVLFRRRALEAVGGFDASLHACEDYDIYLKLARRHPVLEHNEVVAEYRQHDGNTSADKALIAASAIKVLGRQWPHVPPRSRRRRAYTEGLLYWVETYGQADLWPASRWRLRGGGRTRLRAWMTLIHRAPLFMVEQLIRTTRRRGGGLLERRRPARARGTGDTPVVGDVRFGDLRRLQPIDRYFGYQRGTPVDRFYIERFLEAQKSALRGRALESGGADYSRRFGGDHVTHVDILDSDEANPLATVIADLEAHDALPEDTYDCVVLIQTLQLVYDLDSVILNVYGALKPGGSLLLSVPGISKTNGPGAWYWSFTGHSVRRLLERRFPAPLVHVETHGNVLAACAFLQGLAAEELEPGELEVHDPEYSVSIVARATRPPV